jgi:hypothetical protein
MCLPQVFWSQGSKVNFTESIAHLSQLLSTRQDTNQRRLILVQQPVAICGSRLEDFGSAAGGIAFEPEVQRLVIDLNIFLNFHHGEVAQPMCSVK